jgi:hypothetical protein
MFLVHSTSSSGLASLGSQLNLCVIRPILNGLSG